MKSQTVTQQTAVPLSVLGITLPQNILGPSTYIGVQSFGHDSNGRLNSSQGPLDTAPTTYALDDAGNVSSDGTTSFNYAANRLTSTVTAGTTTSYGYDHVGNQVSATMGSAVTATAYDAGFHTTTVTPNNLLTLPVSYGYDALGRISVRSDTSGAVQFYFHEGIGDRQSEEVDTALGIVTTTTRYIPDSAGVPLGQVITGGLSAGTAYDVFDPRGDVVQVLDSSANVLYTYGYDPFGNSKPMQTSTFLGVGPAGSKLQFQAAPLDPTLHEYELGPRLYNPQIDRFVGADLNAASAAGLSTQIDPLTGNRYLYAGANPAGLADDGYCWFVPHSGKRACPGRSHLLNIAVKDLRQAGNDFNSFVASGDPTHPGLGEIANQDIQETQKIASPVLDKAASVVHLVDQAARHGTVSATGCLLGACVGLNVSRAHGGTQLGVSFLPCCGSIGGSITFSPAAHNRQGFSAGVTGSGCPPVAPDPVPSGPCGGVTISSHVKFSGSAGYGTSGVTVGPQFTWTWYFGRRP